MQKTSLFDPPTTNDESLQVKRLIICIEQMIPWLCYAASRHPNSSHADRILRRVLAAVSSVTGQEPSVGNVEQLEATEVDQLRRENERLSSAYESIWAKFQSFKSIGKAMCLCRSGSGEDDSKLYRQLAVVIAD